jgi:hypothetical protein
LPDTDDRRLGEAEREDSTKSNPLELLAFACHDLFVPGVNRIFCRARPRASAHLRAWKTQPPIKERKSRSACALTSISNAAMVTAHGVRVGGHDRYP